LGRLSAIDVVVLAATLLLAIGAGLKLGRRPGSARAWLVGERDVPWWAILLSIVATETSSATFLSVPGIAFLGDLRFLQLPIGYLLGRFLVARWLLPLYFEGDALTTYEVLGRRFGPGVKRGSSLLFLVTRTVADGLRLGLAALPLERLTGLSPAGAIAVMAAVTVAYTFLGGTRAVVWTDVVQFFVYVAGGVLALAVACGDVGGFGSVVEVAREQGKLRLFDFTLAFDQPLLFWAGLVGGAFLALATHGTDQLMVQRYLCARGPREAGRALITSGVVVFAQFALFLFVGLALFAWFRVHPPAARIESGDDVFPLFIVERLTEIRGAVGVILGALFAVSMSTLSSSLNSSAGALVNDWLKPALGRAWSDATTLRVTRASMVGFAFAQAGAAVAGAAMMESRVLTVLGVASFTTGLTLGLFLLARVLPKAAPGTLEARVQGRAALVAFVVMLAAMAAVARWTALAWPWYSVVGSLGTLALGWLGARASLRSRPSPS
jgi:SSS family transporter